MSDLQCPARLVLVRHAEPEYETLGLSDDGGSLTRRGRDQGRALGRALAADRIAHVWCSPMARSVQTAELAAAALGVDVTVRNDLREVSVGDLRGRDDEVMATWRRWIDGDLDERLPGADTGHELVDGLARVIEEVADVHRGEAVLVVSHAGLLGLGVPLLAAGLDRDHAREHPLGHTDGVRCEIDADGLHCVAGSWGPMV